MQAMAQTNRHTDRMTDSTTFSEIMINTYKKKSKFLYFSRLGVEEFNRFKEIYFFSFQFD